MVVAKFREILAVSKQEAQKLCEERFNLRKLNELEVRKRYQMEIKNRFAALENLNLSLLTSYIYHVPHRTANLQTLYCIYLVNKYTY
jgi:hypothetical protein